MCNSEYRLDYYFPNLLCKLLFMEKHYSREKKERKESSTKGRNFATFWRIVEKLKIPHRLRFRSSRYASDTYFPSRFPQLWLYPEHLRSLQACYQTSPRFHDLFTLHPLPTPLYEFTPGLAEFHSNLQGGQSDFSPRDRERERAVYSTQLWIVSRFHDRALIGSPCEQCDTIT